MTIGFFAPCGGARCVRFLCREHYRTVWHKTLLCESRLKVGTYLAYTTWHGRRRVLRLSVNNCTQHPTSTLIIFIFCCSTYQLAAPSLALSLWRVFLLLRVVCRCLIVFWMVVHVCVSVFVCAARASMTNEITQVIELLSKLFRTFTIASLTFKKRFDHGNLKLV